MRFNCALNSRVDHLSRPEDCALNFEGLEPFHESCNVLWMHYFSLTSSPCVPPCFVRLGPFASGWCLALRPSAFSFPLPFQGLPALGQVCWCWCFLFFPLFFCVPRLVFRLGSSALHCHVHFIVTFISSTLLRQGVCVWTICIDVKLLAAWGMAAVSLAMLTKLWDSAGRECGRTFLYLHV